LNKWTTYFTSFPRTPSTSNSNSVWACGEVLFITGIKFIFHVFFEELPHATMWLKLTKGGGAVGLRKKFVLSIESWFFIFFIFFLCSWFYMMSPSMWSLRSKCEFFDFFSRNCTRSIVLKFWVKTPVNKKNSSSLIIANMELRFEPCVLNLI
jgi:hypothetical protein